MRNLKGQFSKRTFFKLPYQDNLKVILPFVYLLIIAFSGSYITEAKAFHHNYIKLIYEPRKFTVVSNSRGGNQSSKKEIKEICQETSVTEVESIEERIRRVFRENGDEAVNVAMCESSLNPETIGDLHLTFYRDGELLGDSIGLFQIRTGGRGWKRGGAEFRELMKDPDENIKYAKELYDKSGWMPWYNCKIKLGL